MQTVAKIYIKNIYYVLSNILCIVFRYKHKAIIYILTTYKIHKFLIISKTEIRFLLTSIDNFIFFMYICIYIIFMYIYIYIKQNKKQKRENVIIT